MKTLTSICLLLLLSCLSDLVESRSLLLNSCSINAHTQELRKYYSSLRANAVSSARAHKNADTSKTISNQRDDFHLFWWSWRSRYQKTLRLELNYWTNPGLKVFRWVFTASCFFFVCFTVWAPSVCLSQDGQTCCLMRLVLRFYIERVFGNYASSQPQDQRCSSSLANSFVTIRRSIHKCVSQCRQLCCSVIHSCARYEKHYWAGDNYCASLCPELPLFGGNTENNRLLAYRVQQGTCCV